MLPVVVEVVERVAGGKHVGLRVILEALADVAERLTIVEGAVAVQVDERLLADRRRENMSMPENLAAGQTTACRVSWPRIGTDPIHGAYAALGRRGRGR